MSDATPDATAGDSRGDVSRDTATVTEAAKRLGVTVRTVQRRLDRGELKSIEANGKRLVVLPAEATGDATADQSVTRQDATDDTTGHDSGDDEVARLLAEKDARIQDLRATVDAQRLQIEAANRTAAEAAAALREALKMSNRALPAVSTSVETESALQAPQRAPETAAGNQARPAPIGSQRPAEREARPLWKVVLGLR